MFKTVDDLQKVTRNGIEATTQSAAILSRGLQRIASEASDYSKKTLEEGSSLWGRLIGVNGWEAALQVQTEFARASYEGLVSEYAKVGEILIDLTKDACRAFERAPAA